MPRGQKALTDRGFAKFIASLICFGSILLAILSWSESSLEQSSLQTNVITHALNSSEIYHWRSTIKNETEIDPKPYCDIPIDYYDNDYYNNDKYHNSNELSMEDIEELKKLRLKDVPMCSPPHGNATALNKYKHLYNNLPPNLASWVNKCEIRAPRRVKKETGGIIAPNEILVDRTDPHHTPLLAFIHIFKSGGTSVRDTMRRTIRGLDRLTWKKYMEYDQVRAYMTQLFVFSFIRDPVDRLLSAHFEIRRRNYTMVAKSHQTGINSVKYLLKSMKNRLDCALAKNKNDSISSLKIWYNIHLLPQMIYLTNFTSPWGFYPLNYVGYTKDLFNSTFEILYELYYKDNPRKKGDKTKKDAKNTYSSTYVHGRDRHSMDYLNNSNLMIHPDAVLSPMELLNYEVEYDDLTDDDIRNICEVYWMDYLCLPFDIPKQCNLTQLFIKHYGENIVYKQCWDYTEDTYDPEFVKLMRKRKGKIGRKSKWEQLKALRERARNPLGVKTLGAKFPESLMKKDPNP